MTLQAHTESVNRVRIIFFITLDSLVPTPDNQQELNRPVIQ